LLIKHPKLYYFKGFREFAREENSEFVEYVANIVKARFLVDELLLGACDVGKKDLILKLYQGTNVADQVIVTLFRRGYGYIVSDLIFTTDVSVYIAAGELAAGILKDNSKNINVLQYLLQHNIPLPIESVEFISEFRDYALHFAAMRDYRTLISILTNGERNTEVSMTAARFGHLQTALHYTTQASYPVVVNEIIKRGNITLFNKLATHGVIGYEAALLAARYKQLDMLNTIITARNLMNDYNFIVALAHEFVKSDNLDYFLKLNYTADIDTIIRIALRYGSIRFLKKFMTNYNDTYFQEEVAFDSVVYMLSTFHINKESIMNKLLETNNIDIIRVLTRYVTPDITLIKHRIDNESSLQVIHALLFNNIGAKVPSKTLNELIEYSQSVDRPDVAFMLSQHK
jgi:hypothetical protein